MTKILLTTRQLKKLTNMLVQAKSKTKTVTKSPILTGLFLCNKLGYHKSGYITPHSSSSFKLTSRKTVSWTYKTHFSCDRKEVIYSWVSKTCDNFHLGQTEDFKKRITKKLVTIFILDKLKILKKELQNVRPYAKNSHSSTCRIHLKTVRDCSQTKLYFKIFPCCYKTHNALRE